MPHPGWLCSSKEIKVSTELGKVILKTAAFQLWAAEARELEGALLPHLQQGKAGETEN